jgi:chemotaxis protein histidine kinase CheA
VGITSRRPKKAFGRDERTGDFAEWRRAFHAQLESERAHFVTLSGRLARVEDNPAAVFLDLRNHAHKIRGAAAMFEIADVAAAACALERASISASNTHAESTDPAVWAALVALVGLMGALEDCEHSAKANGSG